ncbi:unnamed protein product [Lymnaea stagnalis]|uniref:Uncharacterized protein n=1 Tax=Lymnaea stagnalis TaxID=6523 RepID=A0AAV2GWK7_LYMST
MTESLLSKTYYQSTDLCVGVWCLQRCSQIEALHLGHLISGGMGAPLACGFAGVSVSWIFCVAVLARWACMSAVTDQLNCQESAKLNNVQRCFDDQNITGPSMHDSKAGGTIVDAFINKQPSEFCVKKAKYKRAMACVMTQTFNCMLPQFHEYLPQPNKMDAFVEKLCENISRKGVECIQGRRNHINVCHNRKVWEHYNQTRSGQTSAENNTVFKYMCSTFYFYTACLSREGSSCGCPIVEWYQQILKEILYPPACHRPMPGGEDLVCTENFGVSLGLSWHMYVSLVICWAVFVLLCL